MFEEELKEVENSLKVKNLSKQGDWFDRNQFVRFGLVWK